MRACSEAAEPACSMHVSTSTVLPQRAGLHCRRMHASTLLLQVRGAYFSQQVRPRYPGVGCMCFAAAICRPSSGEAGGGERRSCGYCHRQHCSSL